MGERTAGDKSTFWSKRRISERYPIALSEFSELSDGEPRTIFKKILSSDEFKEAESFVRDILLSQEGVFTQEHLIALGAYLFELFAYELVKRRVNLLDLQEGLEVDIGLRVLSPSESFELMRIAYPNGRITTAHMGISRCIDSIKNPDGVLLGVRRNKTVIFGFCEYTLQPSESPTSSGFKEAQTYLARTGKLTRRLLVGGERQQEMGEFVHSKFFDMPSVISGNHESSLFVFVRPRAEDSLDLDAKIQGNTLIIYAPLNRQQFYEAVDGLVADLQLSSS